MSANQRLEMPSHYEKSAESAWRRRLRYVAAVLSGVTAVIYFLIGFRVVIVLDTPQHQIFGLFAGMAYALGVLLLVASDSRELWALGAVLQAAVIYMYFNVASQRSPAYEVWGIALRVVQVLILIALAYLAIRPRRA